MSNEAPRRCLSPAQQAEIDRLFGDEDVVRSDSAPIALPLIHVDEERAKALASGVEEVVEWGHTLTLAIGDRDRWDPSGVRTARLVLTDGTVTYHGVGRTAEEALTAVLDPDSRRKGDSTLVEVHPNSGGLDRIYRSVAFPTSRLDQALQTHALSVGVDFESGSITTALNNRRGGVSRGSGPNFPAALQYAIEGIKII